MNHYFEILELKPGATPDEVKAAYRDLAKVWHPDRFREDSPRLKAKAAEKLAEINEAYEKIRSYQARQKARKQEFGNQQPGSRSGSNYTGYRPYTPRPSSGNGQGQSYTGYSRPTGSGSTRRRSNTDPFRSSSRPYSRTGGRAQSSSRTSTGKSPFRESANSSYKSPKAAASPPGNTLTRSGTSIQYGGASRRKYSYHRTRPRRRSNPMAIYLSVVGVLVIIVAGIVYYINNTKKDGPPSLAEFNAQVQVQSSAGVGGETPESVAAAGTETSDSALAPQLPEDVFEAPSPRINTQKHRGGPVEAGFYTLGSSKEDVVRLQGEPEQVRHGVFRYGFSSVFFEDNVVVGWHQSPSTRLNVQLNPKRAYDKDYFTIGSTRDQVIAVAGTPDHYDDGGREFRYGESRVTFQRGRVVSWHMNPSGSLEAKLLPKYPTNAEVFTLGSSRDVVLSVQGTPDHFSDKSFHYGHSMVHFANDRVSGWNEATNYPLSVVLEPSNPTSSKYFTLGSTRDEVIAAQGTPSQYSSRMLKYGYSTVSFENDVVVSWYQSPASPLNVRSGK